MKIGFDNDRYLKMQSEHIKERIAKFGDKLYLEFGGKLFDDFHASRVLPGFAPDSKLRMLMQLSDYAEIVIVISAADIEKNKIRGDLGITYDVDVLRLRDEFQGRGLYVGSVVITHYAGQHSRQPTDQPYYPRGKPLPTRQGVFGACQRDACRTGKGLSDCGRRCGIPQRRHVHVLRQRPFLR